MQNGGREAAASQADAAPAKRTRRPSVRLHQPYYENPGHRKLQQQWKSTKKRAKNPPTVRTLHSNSKGSRNAGEETEGFDSDDDVAIGNWKNSNSANRGGNFKRKRVRSSNSKKWSRKNEDLEIERVSSSSGSERKEHEESEGEEEEEEMNLGDNRTNSNLVIENSNPSSPNCNDDETNKSSDDNDNVGGIEGRKKMGLSNDLDSNEIGDRVKMWLNELGLGKYATLFEVHGVDYEVLPLLTLEDLKDMGINEVGSRRKLYSSIQKLNKGLL